MATLGHRQRYSRSRRSVQGGPGSGVGPVWPCVVFTLVLPSAILSGARVCVSQTWLCPLGPHTARPCAPLFCCTEAGLNPGVKGRVCGFPGGTSGKECACPCRRRGFHPWVGGIPWRRDWHPAGFLSGESHGWMEEPSGYSHGVAKSRTGLSTQLTPHRT